MKILSPAGNIESLKAAVYNGADEVYLGINNFNARNNTDGFNMENLKNAVDFAHIFGVKVSLAINILFSNDELQSALNTLVDAHNMGVDSFIIQDLGLAALVHKHYPEVEMHASTQMGIHNLEGVKFLEKFGFSRVVLARETSLSEIKRIKAGSKMEIEFFAHGALCVCFSGNCYLSSYLCYASGNRGKCKQLCRLPYSFIKNNKVLKRGYLLSAKDFNMIDKLKDLQDAGVDVIKIEGRARRPYYTGEVTKQYFNALNGNKVDIRNLDLAFNRDFVHGYFDGNGEIISKFNNHVGIEIGQVFKVNYGKKFNEVFFSSTSNVFPRSTLKFFHNGSESATLAPFDLKQISSNKYVLTTTKKISIGDKVNLINDVNREQEILNFVKKRDVIIEIFAEPNLPLKAICFDGDNKLEVRGEVLYEAKNQPLTHEDFIKNFAKNEYFNAKLIFKKFDNIFMPINKLNNFRRLVFDELFKKITKKYEKNAKKIEINEKYQIKRFKNYKIIEKLNENFDELNIIYSPSVYLLADVEKFKKMCEEKGKNAYLDLPNFATMEDIACLKEILNKTKINIVANNYYAFAFDNKKIVGAGLNVYNNISASVFDVEVLTAESDISTKIKFPYMTLRHCPMKANLGANCANCPYEDGYFYKMNNNKLLKLKRKKIKSCTFYLTD